MTSGRREGGRATFGAGLLALLVVLAATPAANADRTGVPASTCSQQADCLKARIKLVSTCTYQVCLFWNPGQGCQVQPTDKMERVCTRQSTYVRWHAQGLTTSPGETCNYEANNWAVEKPVCDTVRCGETAYFNLRDGGSCAAGGEALIRDKSDTYDIKCSPPSGSLPTPCAACNGGSSDACTWSWTAPGTLADALAIVQPTSTKCRCTPYTPKTAAEWLCSSVSSCPNAGRRLLGLPARELKGQAQCAPAYAGTPRCWLRENWAKVLKEQGRGNTLQVGEGDRVISMDLAAIENMCSAWSLSGSYVVPTKTYTPPTPPTCPPLDDPSDPAPNCTVPSWKYTVGSGWASTGGTYEGKGPTQSCNGVAVGACCSNAPTSADCPTSSCHANDLGDVEMNCPNSANCPVRDSSYQATCQKLVAGCSQKCLGYVKCNGAACPDWEGTACFYLGSSNNWKVCTSASCKARGSSAPVPKGADDPSPGDGNSATCVYGKYVWNSGNSKFQQANGVTALNSGNRCNQGANAQCQSNADCAGNCCGGNVGRCPTSSCHANGLGTEERNCPNSARCPFSAGNSVQCVPLQASCRTNNLPHCLGRVDCTGTSCPDWQGAPCVYNGVSNNWKVCSDTTCAAAPAFAPSNQDSCDSVNKLLNAGSQVDPRASTFCEYPNWRNAQNSNTGALTGHTGRCTSSNPADCHGNCEITTTGKCPTSSCIANALGDENLNCPRSARCPVRANGAQCVPYVASCRANGEPHCIGRVACAGGTPCPNYEGMDCFYDGVSDNWKLCFSSGCYANGNYATQAAEGARVKESKNATSNSLPTLAEVGGDQFLATLAATLNVYKDRIDNKGCADGDNDPLDETVIPPSKECGCKGVKGVLSNAHSALSDLLAHPYTVETTDALPLGQVQKCLERINTGGTLVVPDTNDNQPNGLVFDDAPSTCTPKIDPTLPAPVPPSCQPLTAVSYSFATAVNTPFTSSGNAQSLLRDVVSSNPSPVYGILNVLSQPTNNAGTVTVQPGGGFTFTPALGFTGTTRFCATTFDGCTTGQACVDMAVGSGGGGGSTFKGCTTEVSICMPLKTPSAGAKCPPKATLNKLADAIKAAIKAEPGATPDVKDTSCDYLNPTTVMATFKVDVTTASCMAQASDSLLKDLDVDGSACSSKLLASVCGSTVDGYLVDGGSVTQGPSCLPPEFVKASCVVPQTFGAYVTSPLDEFIGNGTSKIGRWIGCCFTGDGASKCVRIRVGHRFQDGRTRTMNPLKQLHKCKDYVIREKLPGSTKDAQFRNAAMPFSLGVASHACVHKHGGQGCTKKWLKSAATAVDCKAGAPGQPGTLVYKFASEMGNIVRSGGNIVATCDADVIDGKARIQSNAPSTIVQSPSASQTTVSSPEWDENCVCKTSGRRPAMRVEVPGAVVGAACKP